MKVICNRGALLEALSVAGNVVATRTPKPVLQCVKLAAEGSELTIAPPILKSPSGTKTTRLRSTQPGEILLPADKLRDIVRESIDDTLSIESSGDMALIKGQDSLFKIPTQMAESISACTGV